MTQRMLAAHLGDRQVNRFLALRGGTALAALTLAALLPAGQAAAQSTYGNRSDNERVGERSNPEYDAKGVPLGGFILHPTVEAGAESNDNFFADDFNTNAEDEVAYTVRGAAELNSNWSRHALNFDVGAQQTKHGEFDNDDATTGYAGVETRIDLARESEIGGGARKEELVEERTAPDALTSAVEPVEYGFEEAFIFAGHTFNRVRLSGRYSHRDYDYDDAFNSLNQEIDQDFRDHSEAVGSARVEYVLSPRLALLAEGVWNERDYDAAVRSSEGSSYTVGASFELARLIDGEVRVGHLEQEYNDGAQKVDGFALNANVDWFPTQLTSVSFMADRQVEDSGNSASSSYLLTRYGVAVDHELFRNVVLSFGATGGTRDYAGIDRDDDFTSIDLSGTYLINRNVSVRAGYAREEVESEGMSRNRTFDINRAFVSLAFRA